MSASNTSWTHHHFRHICPLWDGIGDSKELHKGDSCRSFVGFKYECRGPQGKLYFELLTKFFLALIDSEAVVQNEHICLL